MIVRAARPEDASEACAVLRRSITALCGDDHGGVAEAIGAWTANKTETNFRSWIVDGYGVVAELGGRIAGVAAMTAPREEACIVTLLYVDPDFRFQGVSRALMARLESEALRRGVRTMRLTSTRTALGFYRAAGYVAEGPDAGGNDSDMAKTLEATAAS